MTSTAAAAMVRPILGRECLIELVDSREEGTTRTGRFPGKITKYQEELQEQTLSNNNSNGLLKVIKLYLVEFDNGKERWMDLVQEKEHGRLWWVAKDTDAFPDVQENKKTPTTTTASGTLTTAARNNTTQNRAVAVRGAAASPPHAIHIADDNRKPSALTEAAKSKKKKRQENKNIPVAKPRRIRAGYNFTYVGSSDDDDDDDDDNFSHVGSSDDDDKDDSKEKKHHILKGQRRECATERPVDASNAKKSLQGDCKEDCKEDHQSTISGARKPPPEVAAAAAAARDSATVLRTVPLSAASIVATQQEGKATRSDDNNVDAWLRRQDQKQHQQQQRGHHHQEHAAKRHKKDHDSDVKIGGSKNISSFSAAAASAVPVTPDRGVPTTASSSQQQNRERGNGMTGNWLEDMETWLEKVPHGRNHNICSPKNAKSVMRQVRKLASGQGISYKRWPDGVVFAEGMRVDLSSDLDGLLKEARFYEDTHAKDLGNGWLMRHPIEKMKLFREYVWHHDEE